MWKPTFVILGLLQSWIPLAQAMPSVGDQASYSITLSNQGQTTTSTETDVIVAFDSSKNQFQIQQTVTPLGSSPTVTTSWVDANRLYSNADLSRFMSQCQSMGGSLQSVSVPLGTLGACALSKDPSSTIWYGHAPFGMIKVDATTGTQHLIKSLTSYQFAP